MWLMSGQHLIEALVAPKPCPSLPHPLVFFYVPSIQEGLRIIWLSKRDASSCTD